MDFGSCGCQRGGWLVERELTGGILASADLDEALDVGDFLRHVEGMARGCGMLRFDAGLLPLGLGCCGRNCCIFA